MAERKHSKAAKGVDIVGYEVGGYAYDGGYDDYYDGYDAAAVAGGYSNFGSGNWPVAGYYDRYGDYQYGRAALNGVKKTKAGAGCKNNRNSAGGGNNGSKGGTGAVEAAKRPESTVAGGLGPVVSLRPQKAAAGAGVKGCEVREHYLEPMGAEFVKTFGWLVEKDEFHRAGLRLKKRLYYRAVNEQGRWHCSIGEDLTVANFAGTGQTIIEAISALKNYICDVYVFNQEAVSGLYLEQENAFFGEYFERLEG
jgi:hypothetical protein